LRWYTKGKNVLGGACGFKFPGRVSEYSDDRWSVPDGQSKATVGRCKLKPVGTRAESAWFQWLKPQYDKLLSSFAFSFNVWYYTAVCFGADGSPGGEGPVFDNSCVMKAQIEVGRCRLTPG